MKLIHKSDCSIYNEPAYPIKECDCGALQRAEAIRKQIGEIIDEYAYHIDDFSLPKVVEDIISLIEVTR